MPKSSRHKSHKQSKRSSRDYSDSEEDVVKMKEKSSKDDSVRTHRDSASSEKRKVSSQLREGKDNKDLSGHGNGDALEEYVSSKRRKEKTDVAIGGDRWSGGGDERVDCDKNVEKDVRKGENLKVDSKGKENSGKGESLRVDSKSKSKRHESGNAGERKEDILASSLVDREESKSKGESKRKSERDSSARKEGLKDKDRRSDKEKSGGQESKSSDAEVKIVELDTGKKQGPPGDFIEERQGTRARENTECVLLDELRSPDLEKDIEKRIRRKREDSSEREKHYDDAKEGGERRSSSKGDRTKDIKYRDDKHKDVVYTDKYQDDGYKDDRRRDEKYCEEADKEYKYQDDKYREDGEKDSRRRDDRHRESDRDSRRKDEKHREDGERDSRRKDEKYREGTERDGRRDDKYYEDGDRDRRRKDDHYHEDDDKDSRRVDERYNEDGDRDDRHRENTYREDVDKDIRHKEEKYQEDTERDSRHKDSKQGEGYDRDKRTRDIKYRDERTTRDRSGDKLDLKRSRDDSSAGDHYVRKSSAYDDSPTHDDRAARYRDDQGRRRTNEKEDYSDIKFRGTKDQRSDAERKSTSSARMDLATDRVRSASRNADLELTSSHGRRRSSPPSNSHTPRDHHRTLRQDDSKYRDYNYEERIRPSTRDHAGAAGGSEKTSSQSVEKLGQRDDGHFGEFSAERRLKSDIRSSPLQLADKSPTSSSDRRQFSRPDVRRSFDIEESTQRSGGSREWKEYNGKDVRGTRDAMDVFPGEDFLQGDADTLSISSPFTRSGHFSSSSKPMLPPPLFRTGVDSPLGSGPGDDDGRGKSNIRHRRAGDPNMGNMGRIQGSPWRGVPSWPSPVANGFLPFPHGPPSVGFHSVMQPFPAPPMFGVRPSIELNHPGAYHMSEADRFSGPGRPMGWRNQVDDSCHPLHAWDASNAVFGDESHIYGRSDWDHSRNLPGTRGWDASGDFWKGPNRTGSMEVPSTEKENNSVRSGDEALESQSTQAVMNEQNQVDQQADSTDVRQQIKSPKMNETEGSLEDTGDVDKMSRKDDARWHVYLSKVDISADLSEPNLLDKCKVVIGNEHSISSDVGDSEILYIEDLEAEVVSHRLLNYVLFGSNDDSVFQKSMSLYKRQKKEHFQAEHAEKIKVLSDFVRDSNQEKVNVVDDKTEELPPSDNMQGVEDALPNSDIQEDPKNGMKNDEGHAETDIPVGTSSEKMEDSVSASEPTNLEVNSALDLGAEEHDVEVPLAAEDVEGSSAAPLPSSETKDLAAESGSNNEEVNLVDTTTKCDPLLSSDMFSEASEAMMPESIMTGSVNVSRIHHSPESTH
ncbi:filaggrin-like isoform X2 [Salvia divinorum]|uniref:Filaggrin-like isoform X2 n=1 Tax=Salvia divinorum TaxID=28513 RepID=A0ABD1FK48_SALDI